MGTPHATLFIDITDVVISLPDELLTKSTPLPFAPHFLIAEVSRPHKIVDGAPNIKSISTSNAPLFEHESIPWAFLGTLIFVVGLFYTYYLTVFRFARYPAWYTFPMISFCGCHFPEQFPWRCTWVFAGVCQTMAQITLPSTALHDFFVVFCPRWLRLSARVFIGFHALCSVCVGAFPLYPRQCRESVLYVEDATPWTEMRLDVTALLHYASAVGAGIGGVVGIPLAIAAWHCAFESERENARGSVLRGSENVFGALRTVFVFKVLCCVAMYLALLSMVGIGPICVWYRGFVTTTVMNFVSLSEWALALSMGLFDMCLSIENRIVVRALNAKRKSV